MRRRAAARSDSLELLLDTLCNTFGGVLFIAMLVVTMLQLGGNQPPSSPPSTDDFDISAVQDLEETLATLKAEVAVLRKATRRQADEADSSATREIEDRISASEALRTRLEETAERQDRLVLELSRRQVYLRRLTGELEELDRRLTAARAELQEAEQRAEKVRSEHTRPALLPVVSPTQKRPIGVIVRFGRMYVWHRHGSGGVPLGLNTDEFVVVEDGPRELTSSPKPGAGVPITSGRELRDALAKRLVPFDKNFHYLDVVVRPDSFPHFHRLRTAFAELGFEFSILLASEGQPVTDRGGEGRGVQ